MLWSVAMENDAVPDAGQYGLERTVFRPEIMGSSLLHDLSPLSNITTAWLIDTGWYYHINSSFVQTLRHGAGQGYSFYYTGNPCSPVEVDLEVFSTAGDASQCTLIQDAGGFCEGSVYEQELGGNCMVFTAITSYTCADAT